MFTYNGDEINELVKFMYEAMNNKKPFSSSILNGQLKEKVEFLMGVAKVWESLEEHVRDGYKNGTSFEFVAKHAIVIDNWEAGSTRNILLEKRKKIEAKYK